MTIRVLHITQQLSLGGASRALFAFVKHSRGSPFKHVVASLVEPDPLAVGLAREADLAVLVAPAKSALEEEIERADIVQFHFWNNVEIHAALTADWPQMRSVVWCHVNGCSPPHIISADVFARADRVVASTASTLRLPAFEAADPGRVTLIPGGADLDRVASLTPRAHPDYKVGYIGMLDWAKLHPDFVSMSARVEVPSCQFIVCGVGSAARNLMKDALPYGARFQFKGYVTDIAAEIEQFDVFGYPLCQENSTTSELVLQEVMFAGIPPVVLPYGGAANMVIQNETGIIARDPLDYSNYLRYLFEHPHERARLGRNAAAWARRNAGAPKTAEAFCALYEKMLKEPKRDLGSGAPDLHAEQISKCPFGGTQRLLLSLEGTVPELSRAFEARLDVEASSAQRAVLDVAPGVADMILHYRTRFVEDPMLALWTGLILLERGRPALAAGEFVRSAKLGVPNAKTFLMQSTARVRS